MKWFPDGLDMSTSLPSLPMTAAVLFSIVSVFGKIDLMTFAAIMPAFMAVISCLVLYFVGKDMGGRSSRFIRSTIPRVSALILTEKLIGLLRHRNPRCTWVSIVHFPIHALDGWRPFT